ncbi:Cobalamin synthase [hydrothermal vent metagenome]|uniref:Adenosylcobinamide-GDP ribazoletransferase n=1 Tax=hydrothermal vent metagenome TaxID=652676 RepID=A0A3B0YC45_9ZZZZ
MNEFLIALQFLTRVPLKAELQWENESVARSLLWYPLVGALIGGMLVLLAMLLASSTSPAGVMLSAALLLTAWVFITGGLHLDGLADSADAWVGSHDDRVRALEIMKDPQAGPIAVIVLLLLLLVKFSAIYTLLQQSALWLLLIAPVVARCVPMLLFLSTDYVREQGLGSAMSEYLPREMTVKVLLFIAFLLVVFQGFINGLLLICFVLLCVWVLRRLMIKHIGGMTGDTIGATVEIIEAVALVVLVLI